MREVFFVSNTRRNRYWMHLCTYWTLRADVRSVQFEWVSENRRVTQVTRLRGEGGLKISFGRPQICQIHSLPLITFGVAFNCPLVASQLHLQSRASVTRCNSPEIPPNTDNCPEIPRNSEQIRAHLVTDHWRSSPYDFACHIVLGTVGQRFSVPSSRHILLIRRLRCLLRFLCQITTMRAKQPTSSRKLQTDRSPFLECF